MARERVGAKWDAMRAHMYSVQIQRTLVTIDGGGDESGEGGDEGGEGEGGEGGDERGEGRDEGEDEGGR